MLSFAGKFYCSLLYITKAFIYPNKIKMIDIEKLAATNSKLEELLESLKSQFTSIKQEKVQRRIRELENENIALRQQIELAKSELIRCEIANGKKQITVPGALKLQLVSDDNKNIETTQQSQLLDTSKTEKPSKKVDKPKKEKSENKTANINLEELPVDIGRLDLRVGKIVEVSKHPDADSLYVEKIDCGEMSPRTVVSGLVKFVPIEEMQNRTVVILCNLKPAKMRGVTSEAMVMCASTEHKVEVLTPPLNSVPGDLVHCEGFNRNPDVQLNPKKKIFETVAPDLLTNDSLEACYKGKPWHIPGKGRILAQTLKNVKVK